MHSTHKNVVLDMCMLFHMELKLPWLHRNLLPIVRWIESASLHTTSTVESVEKGHETLLEGVKSTLKDCTLDQSSGPFCRPIVGGTLYQSMSGPSSGPFCRPIVGGFRLGLEKATSRTGPEIVYFTNALSQEFADELFEMWYRTAGSILKTFFANT
jgi:hypothetical protein